MRLLCLVPLLVGSALSFPQPAPSLPQGGQGASALANDAQQFLRSGPLSRVPGESTEVLQSLPPNFPLALIPEGAIPTAASVSPSMTVVVATVKAGLPFNVPDLRAKLERAGWFNSGPITGGFMPATTLLAVCRADEFASYQFRDASNGDRLIRVSLSKESGRSCVSRPLQLFSDVEMPPLTPPPGARRLGAGGSFSADEASTRTRIETSLTLEELVSYFLKLFTQAGWKVEAGPIGDGTMSLTRLSGASRAGEPVIAQLLVTMLPGTQYVDLMARFLRQK